MSGKSEYLFRVKEYPYSEGWIYGDARSDYDFFYGMSNGQYDSSTLGMWSGLMDAKGKLIYAGDVLFRKDPEGKVGYVLVKFSKGRFFATGAVGTFFYDIYMANMTPKSVRVVGNIYEGEHKKFRDIPEMMAL